MAQFGVRADQRGPQPASVDWVLFRGPTRSKIIEYETLEFFCRRKRGTRLGRERPTDRHARGPRQRIGRNPIEPLFGDYTVAVTAGFRTDELVPAYDSYLAARRGR